MDLPACVRPPERAATREELQDELKRKKIDGTGTLCYTTKYEPEKSAQKKKIW